MERAAQPATSYPAICPGHQKAVVELAWACASGAQPHLLFVSASLDKLPMLRDGATGDWIGTFAGHKGAVWSAKVNARATLVATGAADFTAKVWSASTGDELASLEHGHVVRSVAWSPDGRWLATGGHDRKLRVFASEDWGAPPLVLPQPDKISRVVWSDNARVATGHEDGTVRLWDVTTGACLAERRLDAGVADMELSADRALLTVAAGRSVVLLDSSTLAARRTHAMPFQVASASLHPARRYFIAGGSDVMVHTRDAETGAEAAPPLKGHHGTVHCVRFDPTGDTFASGADDALIRLWSFAPPTEAQLPAAAAASPPLLTEAAAVPASG